MHAEREKTSRILETVEVDVPVSVAFEQWTRFEEFPHFMDGVEEVVRIDDETYHWTAVIGGVQREWTARIVEQRRDEKIAWANVDGVANSGTVTFHPISESRCRVLLKLEFVPDGILDRIGDALGLVSRRAEDDLRRFKRYIEERGQASSPSRGQRPLHDLPSQDVRG